MQYNNLKSHISKLLIAVLLLSYVDTYAQNTTFSKIISTPLDESIKDVIEDSLGNFYFVGYNTPPGQFQFKTNGFILKTDNMGNVIDSVTHSNPYENIEYYNVFFEGSSNIDVTGYSSTDFNRPHTNSKIELAKLSNELETINSNSITLPNTYGFQHLKTRRGFDDDFIFVGTVRYASNYLLNPFFIRTSSNFDSIRFNTLLSPGYYGEDIRQLSENQYWFTSGIGSIGILDSLFQHTGINSKIPHELTNSYGIKWDTDTSFYLIGEWNGGPDDDIGFIRQFHPLDTNNNLFNTFGTLDTLDFPADYNGLDFNNKDSIYMGGTVNYGIWNYRDFPSWFFILQTDSMLNIRWERFYGGDAYYVMTWIKSTQDGGCIAIGDRYDYQNTDEEERDIYILKLNSEGLITDNIEIPKAEMKEALVLPNPGTDFLRVRIAAQYPKSTFELFDMNGNLVLKENIEGKWKQIPTSFLPQGTYVYKIHNQEGLFESGKWVKR